MEMRERRPWKPLEGEKVLETEIKTESKTEIRVTQEKVLETERKNTLKFFWVSDGTEATEADLSLSLSRVWLGAGWL